MKYISFQFILLHHCLIFGKTRTLCLRQKWHIWDSYTKKIT